MGQGRGRDEEGRETDLSGFFLSPPPPRFLLGHLFSFRATLLLTFANHKRKPPGSTPEMLGRGVLPGSQYSDLISDKKCHFPHPFSDLEVVTKRNINIDMKQKLCHHC